MRSGRSNQLTKQLGEYLVVAELARRNVLATTFTGNVPHYDILATDCVGHSLAIQVKTINGGAWQLDITKFVNVEQVGERQVLGSNTKEPHPGLICVFVVAGPEYGHDEFYVLGWNDLQEVVINDYRQYLDRCDGRRTEKHDSHHTAFKPEKLARFKDNWDLIRQPIVGISRAHVRPLGRGSAPACSPFGRAGVTIFSPVFTGAIAGERSGLPFFIPTDGRRVAKLADREPQRKCLSHLQLRNPPPPPTRLDRTGVALYNPAASKGIAFRARTLLALDCDYGCRACGRRPVGRGGARMLFC